MRYDVAVIGAGVFGAWTAHHLRRAGLRVVLVDAYGPAHSRASSGGESRIIRMGYGADEIYTRSAMRSLVLWKAFCEETGQQLFHPTGVLWTASEDDPYARSTRQTLERCGALFESLSPEQLAARYPQMRFAPGAWGILEPGSGALMARRAVQAVVEDAQRLGTAFVRARVEAPGGSGPIAAGVFVFACGPWLPRSFRICSDRVSNLRARKRSSSALLRAIRASLRQRYRYGSISAIRADRTAFPIWKIAG